ncbi:YadA-like family protein, partial [uncultured Sneathia sp.]|uniref:YadA-like family protein n=1 Tax=uncultured Sneathia sp. TaxID=278067 RepID=UPI002595D912
AGTVVYTDKDGNRLVKANDGKYYNSESVDDKGNLKVGNSYANEVKDIFATVVNSDGSTKKPTTKLRIADGSISVGSKDAINGGQLHTELAKKLDTNTYNEDKKTFANVDGSNLSGLTDDKKKAWATGIGLSSISDTTKDQLVTDTAVKTYVSGKEITVSGDKGNGKLKLDGTLSIVGRSGAVKTWKHDQQEDYTTENVMTHYEDNKLYVGLKEKPTFKSLTLKDGDNKKVELTPTESGLSLNNKKLTGLADGTDSTDAVNKKQLDEKANRNASNLSSVNLKSWSDRLGHGKVEKDNKGLVNGKAVYDFVNPIIQTVDENKESIDKLTKNIQTTKNQGLKFNADQGGEQTQKLGSSIKIASATGEISDKNIKYLGKNIKTKITKTGEDSTISLAFSDSPEFSSVKIGDNGKTVSITTSDDGGSITGLKDTSVDNTKYGQSGVVATQKEVKAVLNKVHSNEIEQKKIKDGLAGAVVYTDKDGNKLVKLNGKFYKQSELKNGELPVGSSYKDGIKEEDIFLSTVNSDGKTTKPITLGNVASALGLSKDSKNNNEILKKLINKEAKKDVYKDAELNKAVTLRDLQFLASKGITFAGSTGTANKYLGDTISINSKTSDYKDLNNGGFTTNYVTKNIAVKVDNTSGDIEIGLAKELKNIKSISSENDKSKIELTDSGLKLTNDNATLSIEKDDNGFKLSGLKDLDINNGYGQSGVAATQKEVKDVLDKVNKNIKGQNDLKDGLAGTVIYTDKDGNKLVKVNGAYYKQSDVKDDGNIKDNATSISSDNIKVTLVGADGSIDKGVTLGNLKSTLGLNKANNGMTEINKKIILSKLTGNENYSEKELDNAVSLRDLQFVAKTGLVFSGNSGSVIKPIGETVRIIGGAKLSEKILEDTSSVIDPKAKYSDNGKEDFEKNFTSSSIATRVNEEGNIQIGISKDIKDIRTIEFTKGENEKAIGKIKGLANGEISSTSNDAINGAQLNDILDNVGIKVNDDKTGFNTLEISEIGGKKPSNILEGLNKTIESVNEQSVGYKANNGKVETVKLKEGFNFVNGTNITASVAKDGEIKYSLNKELKGIKGIELKNKDKKLSLAVNNKGEAVIRREESIQSTEKVITTDDKLKLKFKSSTASDKNEKVINIAKNEALDFKAGSNLTSKVSDGSIEYGLKSDLKGITSISSENDKSKIELTDSGLKLTNDNATLSIEKDDNGFKLSGLKDLDINNGYGQSGVAATQKEVKDVLDKVNKNIKGQNDLKDGLAGTVIYTDKDGNKLVKVNGKFYKQSELKNGELPVGSSYKDGIKEKDIFLSTVNSDGSTTTPTTKLRIADGSISAGSKEAVTGGQVYELKNKIEDISKKQFIKIKGDTNDEQTLNLGDTLEVVGEGDTTPAETAKNNITVQADKNKLTVKLAKKLQNMKSFETEAKDGNKTTLNQDGLKIGNDTKAVKITNESITGLTERKVSGSDYGEKGRAATEGAVKEVYDKLNTLNQGLTFKANKGQTKKEIGKILGVLGGATLKEKLIEDRSSIIDPKAKSSDNGKEDFDTNYNSKNVATRVSEDNNIHIGVSKELKDMRSFETEKDVEGNSSKLNQKELSIIGKDGDSINISNNEIKFGKNGGTISGLKEGKIEDGSTDAVSGGQVYEKLKTIDSHLNTNYYNKSKINEMIGDVDKKSTVALEKSELALGGVANAVAMANLVQVNSYSDYRHNLSAAYGYYGGSHALAVGFSGTNEERNFVYKLSGSVNNKGNLAFGVGAGVMLGEENENNYPEKVKKVSELENKVKKQEEEINKLKKQAEKTDMLEKQVAELMKLIKKKK